MLAESYKKTVIALFAAVAATSSCLSVSGPTTSSYGSGGKRILFVGNSLTGANDMPLFFVALAESAKVSPAPSVQVDWEPDFALIDHWNVGFAQGLITGNKFSVVVLQQGPSSVAVNRDTLRLAAKLFAPLVRNAGGMPAMMAVWPTADRFSDFDRATESYQLAAKDVSGAMIPTGEVWRAAWKQNPSLSFYSPDGLHPSALGSYAMALSLLGILYDRSVVGLPSSVQLSNGARWVFDPAVAAIVQQAADQANGQYGLKGTP